MSLLLICADCANGIEKGLNKVDGLNTVNFALERATFTYDSKVNCRANVEMQSETKSLVEMYVSLSSKKSS